MKKSMISILWLIILFISNVEEVKSQDSYEEFPNGLGISGKVQEDGFFIEYEYKYTSSSDEYQVFHFRMRSDNLNGSDLYYKFGIKATKFEYVSNEMTKMTYKITHLIPIGTTLNNYKYKHRSVNNQAYRKMYLFYNTETDKYIKGYLSSDKTGENQLLFIHNLAEKIPTLFRFIFDECLINAVHVKDRDFKQGLLKVYGELAD